MGKNVSVKTLGEIRKKESISNNRISGTSLRELAKNIYNNSNWNIENLNKWFGATIPENSRMTKRDSLNLLKHKKYIVKQTKHSRRNFCLNT